MITHHDNQKIDGNELFMIEDVPTHEYDDDTENPKASSVGKASTNMKETQLDRRGLDRRQTQPRQPRTNGTILLEK